ncbi:acyltransferase domain-containing protein, partial [Streptomyces sp. NPDC057445]|uniref:acyltransferase domain-containing protein n=1 Tax=Streptomyces sp. NPDC057445 TaxID=3346136 RepID=UPI00367DB48B
TDAETLMAALVSCPGVEIAAFNAPRVQTITGPVEAVRDFCEHTPHRTQLLTVSHAFHSAAMEGAVVPFADAVAATRLKAPTVAFATTLTGGWHTPVTATDPDHWAQAIRRPVRFTQALATVHEADPDAVWEIGPHPQLVPLARAAVAEPHPVWISTLHRDRNDQVQLHTALAAHHNRTGTALNWAALHQHKHQHTTTIPTYPFNRQRFWIPAGPADAGDAVGLADSTRPHETKRHEHHG